MDVVQRNFFRLLRSGTFGSDEAVEPMSAWKWSYLHQLSLMHGVAALVYDGIQNHRNEFFMQLPAAQTSIWEKTARDIEQENRHINASLSELFSLLNKQQLRPILLKGQGIGALYDQPLHRTGGDIDIYFPYEPQARKAAQWAKEHATDFDESEKHYLQYRWHGIKAEHHKHMQRLTNMLHNRTLQKIIDAEIRCCDSAYVIINGMRVEVVPPTLDLLLILLRITRYMLNEGISLKQIVDLGMFLRKKGDKVDFVKLQSWLKVLKLQRIAHLQGALLVRLFHFSEDEIPFMTPDSDKDIETVMKEIFALRNTHADEWYFTQGKNIFVRSSDSTAMFWHLRRSTKYFSYYPSETVTNLFASFAHSLSHIEE